MASLLSVLIPARNETFLNRTIAEVFTKAAGEVECVVLLDGDPPAEPLPEDRRLTILENKEPQGIGSASWRMANAASGDYIMKLDAHCLLAEGYDAALKEACDYEDLVVPSRYQLKDETWTRGYGPITYNYLTYPWLGEKQFGAGLHGKKWLGETGLEGHYFWMEKQRQHLPIDDIQTFQGSLFFMHRRRFLELGGVHRHLWLWQEAQSIGFKVWLSGGRCIGAKSTWYAHLHKGERHGRGFKLSRTHCLADNLWSADFWMNDRWQSPLRTRDMHWFVGHFWPIPGWPDDWDNPRYQAEALRSGIYPGLNEVPYVVGN